MRRTIKKALAAVGIGAALATGALAIAPTASASPQGFLNDMHAEGFWNTNGDTGLLTQGFWVCNELDKGYTPDNVAMRLDWVNNFDGGAVGKFAAIATIELCPFHAGQGWDDSRPLYAPSRQLNRAV